jgi:Cu/Ag efflux protein CusF
MIHLFLEDLKLDILAFRCADAATAKKATAQGEKCTLSHPPLSEISWGALGLQRSLGSLQKPW